MDRLGGFILQSASMLITNSTGIHARPAAELVKLAKKFESCSILYLNNKKANCCSILEVMALGAIKGTEVVLMVEGKDENKAFDVLKNYIVALKE